LQIFNKIQELVGFGLSEQEAKRVVGHRQTNASQPVSGAVHASEAHQPTQPGHGPPSGQMGAKCFHCKKSDVSLARVPQGVWLCEKCRKLLRRARKAEKRRAEFASYYGALTQPELHGLKGIRK
jgi:hypothetical protein